MLSGTVASRLCHHARLMHNSRGQAHIFLPLAVFLGASRLTTDRKRQQNGHYAFAGTGMERGNESALDGEFQTCMNALSKMQSFNHLARDHLAVLESQEFGFGGF
jgi:hypothetical protein